MPPRRLEIVNTYNFLLLHIIITNLYIIMQFIKFISCFIIYHQYIFFYHSSVLLLQKKTQTKLNFYYIIDKVDFNYHVCIIINL